MIDRTKDVAAVLGLLDGAVRWLVEQGRTGQWGTEQWTGNAKRTAQVTGWAVTGGLYLDRDDDGPLGALAVGPAPDYLPPATEPELYVNLLVADPARGTGSGGRLLAFAADLARALHRGQLRVDCYAGGDGALVRYYERRGFVRTDPIAVGTWPGQVLVRRV
jgi:GNAT superfamily N-acetyltransferase